MTGWKYVGWDDSDGIPHVIVFDPTLTHAHMVPRHVVPRSAGFVTAKQEGWWDSTADGADGEDNVKIVFRLSGHSESLNLRPRPEDSGAFDISK